MTNSGTQSIPYNLRIITGLDAGRSMTLEYPSSSKKRGLPDSCSVSYSRRIAPHFLISRQSLPRPLRDAMVFEIDAWKSGILAGRKSN
jgi:hypothetical protein